MVAVADPAGTRAHDAYHRFVRDGAWAMSGLWRVLAVHAVTRFAPAGALALDCDDTLFHKSGRSVNGAGIFRDAVRSTAARVVHALGLNLVVLTLRVHSLAGAGRPRTHLTSRIRRDAALYEPAPPRTGKRGRPRTRGARLPTPPELAAQASPGTGAPSTSTCVADPFNGWSMSATCSGTPSTNMTCSAWSSSATRMASNPTTSSSPPT